MDFIRRFITKKVIVVMLVAILGGIGIVLPEGAADAIGQVITDILDLNESTDPVVEE